MEMGNWQVFDFRAEKKAKVRDAGSNRRFVAVDGGNNNQVIG